MIALFIAGGSGTRLWPLSIEKKPKQLHNLIGDKSLMLQSVERVTPLISAPNIWVVTNKHYAKKIARQSLGVPKKQIIVEPFPIGTTLAVGLGIMHIAQKHPDATVVVGWADAHIKNETEFRAALQRAQTLVHDVEGVILAVPAEFPATDYGYIKLGGKLKNCDGAFKIARFEEKPNAARAVQFVEKNYYWNTGITVWKATKLLALIRKHKPDHYAALEYVAQETEAAKKLSRMEEAFKGLDRTAIDRAIFEKAKGLAAIPVNLAWRDIGSWRAVYDIQEKNKGNATYGTVVTIETDKCLIYSQKRLVATLGVSDLVIVETDEAVLIVHKDKIDRLKELHSEVRVLTGEKYL